MFFLVCLAATAAAQQATTPPATQALDDVVATGERERKPRVPVVSYTGNPSTFTIERHGTTLVRLQAYMKQAELRFRRASSARVVSKGAGPQWMMKTDLLLAIGNERLREVNYELEPDVEETDGLPALIPFGVHTSLVNVDYVRLQGGTARNTVIRVANGLQSRGRSCGKVLNFADDQDDNANRFVLLGDELGDCERALLSRDGDLLFAEAVPEPLRREFSDLYAPVYNQFARLLGSEPAFTFVVWRPDSPRNDVRIERNWNMSSLVLFNGDSWRSGLSAPQREALWEKFALEQIVRRLAVQVWPDAFTQSAVNYLMLLARSARDHSTSSTLAAELPAWIAACSDAGTPAQLAGYACGLVLQFTYDAVARARSKGEDTLYGSWRKLLADSYRRGQSGVQAAAFMAASAEARRIAQGLTERSMDWSRFVADLDRFGARLRLSPGAVVPPSKCFLWSTFVTDQAS